MDPKYILYILYIIGPNNSNYFKFRILEHPPAGVGSVKVRVEKTLFCTMLSFTVSGFDDDDELLLWSAVLRLTGSLKIMVIWSNQH